MKRKILPALAEAWRWQREISSWHLKAIRHGMDLKASQKNIKNIKPKDIVLCAVMKNEAHRLKFFIEYYRKLGVNHFILVDNGSTDHFKDVVAGQDDISTFYTEASYKNSNYGMHWVNYLLLRYGCGHWCLTCDPDELLVYPYMETRDLRDLTEYLDSIKEESLFTAMVDMYSDKAVEESDYQEGTDPLQTCPFFDGTGYVKSFNPGYRNTFLQGGVRRRVFYADEPEKSPALNKVPLIKWGSHVAYVESMHMAIPRRLNELCVKSKVTGALLHYKFINQLVQKVEEEAVAKQHWDNSSEYTKYGTAIQERTVLYDPSVSMRYENWRTLARHGLVNLGEWSV